MEQVAECALREPTWILQEPLEKRSPTVWHVQKVKCHNVLPGLLSLGEWNVIYMQFTRHLIESH